MLLFILLYFTSSSILLESIPGCDEVSVIYLKHAKDYTEITIPYYLLSCYYAPHTTTLMDMAKELTIQVKKVNNVIFDIMYKTEDQIGKIQSPALFTTNAFMTVNPFVSSLYC